MNQVYAETVPANHRNHISNSSGFNPVHDPGPVEVLEKYENIHRQNKKPWCEITQGNKNAISLGLWNNKTEYVIAIKQNANS